MPREPTFEEIVAGDDPVAQASIEVIEAFTADQVEVHLIEDRGETLEWGAEYFDGAGGGYVTIFAGQRAEQRARAYFLALKSGRLEIICDGDSHG
jgi:hypothetical protein